jgi:hypothetical protein
MNANNTTQTETRIAANLIRNLAPGPVKSLGIHQLWAPRELGIPEFDSLFNLLKASREGNLPGTCLFLNMESITKEALEELLGGNLPECLLSVST